jgi:predicted dehydrogenase
MRAMALDVSTFLLFNLPMTAKPFQISRRSFLTACSTTAAATGLPVWFLEREAALAAPVPERASPNDRPAVALVGCGGMGRGDANYAQRFADVVAVCDVDASHADAAAKQLSRNGKTPAKYGDFRKVLERDDIHVIIQATPDHWHTLINLAAARVKKDVYSEKPLTLTLDEGKRLVKAVRDNKIVLQTGSQQRSDKNFRLACELVRNGRIGKLIQATVFLPAGLRGGPFRASPVPSGLDWDYWLGQAPKVDYVKERCHLTFRYWLDYSGGTLTDWGAHHNDIARWAIGLDGPVEVQGTVLEEPVPGGYTAISHYEVTFTYANGIKQVVQSTKDDNIYGGAVKKEGQHHGVRFEGTEGWIWVTRGELMSSNEDIVRTPLPDNAVRLEVSQDHMANFFESVRLRKDPICNVEVGHRSVSMCHLAVIALRLRRKLRWDPERELFVGEGAQAANAYVAREMRRPYDYTFAG